MKHLLIDCDSKIPNLVLMKVSRHVKSLGSEPELCELKGRAIMPLKHMEMISKGEVEKAWISVIFTWNRSLAEKVAGWLGSKHIPVEIGGTGISLKVSLPDEIETLLPDYGLYKGNDRALGFVQRGCVRRCDHCVVPIKEGRLQDNPYNPIESWVPDGYKKVLLLDNEFAAMSPDMVPWLDRDLEAETLSTAKAHGWKLSITQGYDLRCVNERKAALLADWKPYDIKFVQHTLYTAWDIFGIGPRVRTGIETLLRAGFKGTEIMCYCLCGKSTSHFQDYYRFHVLWKKYGVRPYMMKYNKRMDDRFLNALARYVDRGPAGYRNHGFDEYCERRAPDLVDEVRGIIDKAERDDVDWQVPYNMPPMVSLYK